MGDRIEKSVELAAPVSRVWRALTDHVEFGAWLQPTDAGTRLVITESGFDRVPEARREEAFRMNDRGWGEQVKNIARHIDGGVASAATRSGDRGGRQ